MCCFGLESKGKGGEAMDGYIERRLSLSEFVDLMKGGGWMIVGGFLRFIRNERPLIKDVFFEDDNVSILAEVFEDDYDEVKVVKDVDTFLLFPSDNIALMAPYCVRVRRTIVTTGIALMIRNFVLQDEKKVPLIGV